MRLAPPIPQPCSLRQADRGQGTNRGSSEGAKPRGRGHCDTADLGHQQRTRVQSHFVTCSLLLAHCWFGVGRCAPGGRISGAATSADSVLFLCRTVCLCRERSDETRVVGPVCPERRIIGPVCTGRDCIPSLCHPFDVLYHHHVPRLGGGSLFPPLLSHRPAGRLSFPALCV